MFIYRLLGLALAWTFLPLAAGAESALVTCKEPHPLAFKLKRVIRRDRLSFTEGLIFWKGALYESSGLYSQSRLSKISPDSGKSEVLATLPDSWFGEGLARIGAELFELTWKENFALRWTFKRFADYQKIPYSREGWGLTSNPQGELIASDGSSHLYFLKAQSFGTERTLTVHDAHGEVSGINELEFIKGKVWANIWPTYKVVVIDPGSGCVSAELDLSTIKSELSPEERAQILSDSDHVPNGIAYDPTRARLFFTAKNWPIFFEMSLPK